MEDNYFPVPFYYEARV